MIKLFSGTKFIIFCGTHVSLFVTLKQDFCGTQSAFFVYHEQNFFVELDQIYLRSFIKQFLWNLNNFMELTQNFCRNSNFIGIWTKLRKLIKHDWGTWSNIFCRTWSNNFVQLNHTNLWRSMIYNLWFLWNSSKHVYGTQAKILWNSFFFNLNKNIVELDQSCSIEQG